tara:strand:- start:576 stop:1145 length:570 start_codon:yes stop_codon:yes gene_type:complete
MIIEQFFPTLIAHSFCDDHRNIQEELTEYCLKIKGSKSSGGQNWLSKDTYNTSNNQHNIVEDKKFEVINNFIKREVANYLKQIGSTQELKMKGGWLNIYEKNNYQEYHNHPDSVISTIYFLNVNKNSAKVSFKNPYREMITLDYKDNFDNVVYVPENGKLIIFRSHLEHAVEKQTNEDMRITLSHNFVK